MSQQSLGCQFIYLVEHKIPYSGSNSAQLRRKSITNHRLSLRPPILTVGTGQEWLTVNSDLFETKGWMVGEEETWGFRMTEKAMKVAELESEATDEGGNHASPGFI